MISMPSNVVEINGRLESVTDDLRSSCRPPPIFHMNILPRWILLNITGVTYQTMQLHSFPG